MRGRVCSDGYTRRVAAETRWAGVSRDDRRSVRRDLLIEAAFELFGTGGEGALSVRAVSRESGLNHRYFYESFNDLDELLGAVYDKVYSELRRILTAATVDMPDDRSRLRGGIRAVLDFSAADPRHGQILFSAAPTSPALVERRAQALRDLREYIFAVRKRDDPRSDPVAAEVAAAIYAGATTQLNEQWRSGSLGTDLDRVIEQAVEIMTPDPTGMPAPAKGPRKRSR